MGQCLKCGKTASGKAVFCRECLEVMDRYPVRPGTVVHIPVRPAPPAPKTLPGTPSPALTAHIRSQKKLIRLLLGGIVLLSILSIATAVMLIRTITSNHPEPPADKGRNFTITPH